MQNIKARVFKSKYAQTLLKTTFDAEIIDAWLEDSQYCVCLGIMLMWFFKPDHQKSLTHQLISVVSKEKRLCVNPDRRSNKRAAYEYIIYVTQQAFVMIICNGQMKQRALRQQRQKYVSPNGRSHPADVTRASVCVFDSWACVSECVCLCHWSI